MTKKILILLSMVVFHAACSGGGQTQAAIPQSSVVAVAGAADCPANTEAFEGAQAYGNSEDVVCLQSSTLALYGHSFRKHGHDRGFLCRDEADRSCGKKALCQPFPERNYGFCMIK